MYLDAEAGQRSGVLEQGFLNRFLFPNLKKKTKNKCGKHYILLGCGLFFTKKKIN